LNHFGKFHNATISLKDGINLIYGDNEAGKTTIHSFIRGMLFGIEKLRGRASKEDPYLRYQPWDSPGAYNGSMDLEIEGKLYRIIRNFDKSTKGFYVIDIETGRELDIQPENMKDLYGGLTEAGFRNTISTAQLKAATDSELAGEVRNYITNLSLSKSDEVDITKALSFLQNKTKELEAKLAGLKLEQLEKEIAYGVSCEERIDRLSLELEIMKEQEKLLPGNRNAVDIHLEEVEGFTSLEEYNFYVEQFPAVKEKYKNYCQLQNQMEEQKKNNIDLQRQIYEIEHAAVSVNYMKQQISEIENKKREAASIELKRSQIISAQDILQRESQKNLYIIFAIAIIFGAVALFVIGFNSKGYLSIFAVIAASGLLYQYLTKHNRTKRQTLTNQYKDYEAVQRQLKKDIGAIFQENGVEDEISLRNKYDDVLREELSKEHIQKELISSKEQLGLLDKKREQLTLEIRSYISRFDRALSKEDILEDTISDVTLDRLEAYISKQKSNMILRQQERQHAYEEIIIQKEKIKWELDALGEEEAKLLRNRELYQEYQQEKQEASKELEAIKLASDTLRELSFDIHNHFGKELNQLVSEISDYVTNGKYHDIKLDEKLDVKVGQEANYIRLDRLSAGTVGQIYFALRIGIADLIYGKGVMPIILDDCFAFYDDSRVRAALKTLVQETNTQVIIFTCHHREKLVLDEMCAKYNYIDLAHYNEQKHITLNKNTLP
jgi:DNA repair exonuclease SbcCD ATPase subunit